MAPIESAFRILQVKQAVAFDHVEAIARAGREEDAVHVHAARSHALLAQKLEPFAAAASQVDDGAPRACGIHLAQVRQRRFAGAP
jgi:hypothetical protein